MATRLTGWEAIAFAERNQALLSVHAASGAESRDDVTVDEARKVAETQPERVYLDFDEPDGDTGQA